MHATNNAIFFPPTLCAVDVSISLKGSIAPANFLVVLCQAGCTLGTRLATTQRLALALDLVADLIVSALIIVKAANIKTSHKWVALLTTGTEADGDVIFSLAFSTSSTLGLPAWINALLISASLIKWTVLVGLALI